MHSIPEEKLEEIKWRLSEYVLSHKCQIGNCCIIENEPKIFELLQAILEECEDDIKDKLIANENRECDCKNCQPDYKTRYPMGSGFSDAFQVCNNCFGKVYGDRMRFICSSSSSSSSSSYSSSSSSSSTLEASEDEIIPEETEEIKALQKLFEQ